MYNIYAPASRDQRVEFLEQLPLIINPILSEDCILFCGDFNNLVDNALDNINGSDHQVNEISAFNKFINNLDLIDSWRSQHPYVKDFSWIRMFRNNDIFQNNPMSSFTARRLDYIFINKLTNSFLANTEMIHFSGTDHKAIVATFKTDNFPRGRGLWKFNESMLEDNSFIDTMSAFITHFHEDLTEDLTLSKGEIWDLLKIGIRDKCVAFARDKKIESWENISLDQQIHDLSSELSSDPDNIETINKLALLSRKKEILELSVSNGALRRSKVKHIFEGEKNSSFFLGLERSRQSQQIIKEVFDKENKIVNSPSKILIELSSFYKELMNEEESGNGIDIDHDDFLNTFLEGSDYPTLAEADKVNLDSPIILSELDGALKSLNFDSSPGSDGLSPIFYSSFWEILKIPLFNSYIESIENKSLTLSQRRAILTLLPKSADGDSRNVANYRPISLTNTDYKIYSKILAMRMQTILEKIIHKNQVGYVEGRSINDHIRLIDDIINTSNNEDLGGMLVSLDYRKAFDTLSKSSILATLKKFNFGPSFINFVSTIINGTEASVKNAGWHSEWFRTTRGVRQGCGLSPLLFILVVEILAIKIRSKTDIKGVLDGSEHFPQDETKLIAYADDLNLFIKTIKCLKSCLKEIDAFSSFSGLYLNRTKSLGMWLGRDKDNPPGGEGLKWLNKDENVRILGVYFNPGTEASLISINWEIKIKSIESTISHWNKRRISIWGKSLVSKTFLLSKLNFIIQSLALPYHILDQIDDIIFSFLWTTDSNRKGSERLKRNTLCLDASEGGLSMISIKDQQEAFLMKSINRINKDKLATHYKILNHLLNKVGGLEYFLLCNTNANKFVGVNTIKSHYWKRAVVAWLNVNASFKENKNTNCPVPLFNNDIIVYKKYPLFLSNWIQHDIKYVHNFIINNRLKTFEEIRELVGHSGGLIFNYLAVKNAVLNSNINYLMHVIDPNEKYVSDFLKTTNKCIRNAILKQKIDTLRCISTWERKLGIDITIFFSIGMLSTNESKLRVLHFKIVHHIYPTNIILKKMKIKENELCDNCPEVETLEHLFFNCIKLRTFWGHISTLVSMILEKDFSINVINALFGISYSDIEVNKKRVDKANHMILIAKMCISKSKAKISDGKSLRYIFEYEKCLRQKQLEREPD